jgi:hypothetical protein
MNNHTYEEQTRRLLAEAKSEMTGIGNQMAELQHRWETLKKEAEAYETALQGYLRRIGKQETAAIDWAKLLEGKTHKEKLTTIAERNGGKVKISQATDILYSNSIIKSKKRANAYIIIQSYLAEMAEEGKFEKVKPGEYKLIGAQLSLPR